MTRLARASRAVASAPGGSSRHPSCRRPTRGFSLIDLLVSIAVIAILISILAPALSGVTESARRVRCMSNMRQIGLGLTMYLDQHHGMLPPSMYTRTDPNSVDPHSMMVLHLGDNDPNSWDGLGYLFGDNYVHVAELFYCPSHSGFHPFERYADAWVQLGHEIVGNYQFRLFPPEASTSIKTGQDPLSFALLSDGMRTRPDYNHRVGNNLLKTDLSVAWYNDVGGYIAGLLPADDNGRHRGMGVTGAWDALDHGGPPSVGDGGDVAPEFRLGPDGGLPSLGSGSGRKPGRP